MKNLLYFCFAAIILSSCGKEVDEGEVLASLAEQGIFPNGGAAAVIASGPWRQTAHEETEGEIYIDGVKLYDFTVTSSNFLGNLNYLIDSTFSSNLGFDYVTTLEAGGQTFPQPGQNPQITSNGKWTYDEEKNQIIMDASGLISIWDITALTSSRLEITYKLDKTENIFGSTQRTLSTVVKKFQRP